MAAQRQKQYVRVAIEVDEEGTLHPLFIRWKNGAIYQIDQILYKCRVKTFYIKYFCYYYTQKCQYTSDVQ